MQPFLLLTAGKLTCILALGYVLMVFLFDCFEVIPNRGSVEDPSSLLEESLKKHMLIASKFVGN